MRPVKAMCGACGAEQFEVELQTTRSPTEVHLICCACKSRSIVGITEPQIEIRWGKDAEGIVCPK